MRFRTGNSGPFLAPKDLWTVPPLLRLMACGRLPGCLNLGCMQSKDGAGSMDPSRSRPLTLASRGPIDTDCANRGGKDCEEQ